MKNTSTSLLKKLAEFKQEEINIPKDTKAYGYNYSPPLDTVLPIIEPLLYKHGLWYFHYTDYDKKSGKNYLITIIYEIEGEKAVIGGGTIMGGYIQSKILIDEEVTLAKMNKFMVIGSALTYFRRYHLVCMLGLLTDEDTDAGASPGGGRSVESAAREVDYADSYKKILPSKKTLKEALSTYKKYEHHFSDEQVEEIQKLIAKKFPDENK